MRRNPSSDPMRAPTKAGLHPHLLRAGVERHGEQQGYESVSQVQHQLARSDRQELALGAVPATQGQSIMDLVVQHPFLAGIAILGAAWGISAALDSKSNSSACPPAMPGSVPFVFAVPGALPTPGISTPATQSASAEPTTPKKPKKTRRTTQARDSSGRYLTSNTRARAVTEGRNEAKE